MQRQIRARRYDYTETDAMWNVIGEFLRLSSQDNAYIYGKYSYALEMPDTAEHYILKRNNHIIFENFWFYFEQVTSVHLHQLVDAQGRVIRNPLRIDLTESDNTDPFGPRKALYMSVTVSNYNGPEIPDEDKEDEQYTKEYYFMKTAYGIFVSDTGFGAAQNMHLIPTTETRDMSDEEMVQLIRSAYVDDFSEEESDENEISISNRSNDNSHVPLM